MDGRFVHNWFSNMLPAKITLDGIGYKYATSEHFYQSFKAESVLMMNIIRICATPQEAKRLAKKVEKPFEHLIGHYGNTIDEVKLFVMETALRNKFDIPEWKQKLLTIRPTEPIIEWNNWNDTFWGVCVKTNKGENHLGKLLMKIRSEFQENGTEK